MNIKTFKRRFKPFAELDNLVFFGDTDNRYSISAKSPEVKVAQARVEIFQGDVETSSVTTKQLLESIKLLKDCDDFDLIFVPTGGGGWPVQLMSEWPKNGVVFLDTKKEISD